MAILTADEVIKDFYSKAKTPYHLDLEVKDRKPSIVPKVGDRVKIKSRDWYEKWKGITNCVDVHLCFTEDMRCYCGVVFEVEAVKRPNDFRLKNVSFCWSLEMFEEVYPVQEQLSSKFPRIDLSCPLPLQSPYEVKGSELVLSKEQQERLKQQLREKWGVKPKLKQVKTTHLIKLKKL